MKMKGLLFIICVVLMSCTAPDEATEALRTQGYTDIEITGFELFGCSKDDVFKTGFNATTIAGYRVHGVVCSGWLKGYTIRLK